MRQEYPRPQFRRENWLNLNGSWGFAFDNQAIGLEEHWERPEISLPLEIQVPFCPESPLSGIHDTSRHEHVWYKRDFNIPSDWQGRVIMHFGAVDYRCKVYINGKLATSHTGGHVSFSVDVTDYLTEDWQTGSDQQVTVFVSDPTHDEEIPRGKQTWRDDSFGIYYTRTTGIWQTVWLENVNPIHVDYMKMTPDIDNGLIDLKIELAGLNRYRHDSDDLTVEIDISFEGEAVSSDHVEVHGSRLIHRAINVLGLSADTGIAHGGQRLWWPHNPNLFDIKVVLYQKGKVIDAVDSYFGMRKVHEENGLTYLNNHPYYYKLVLDQGYWPDGLMTAPTDEALKFDIEACKEMGFNGCRKHQKVEDPRFMYWADKLGYLVWGEIAAPGVYTDKAAMRLQHEWAEIIRRDYNHPSIVAWVPFNESWGIPEIQRDKAQQAHTEALYYMLKSIDQTRPVVNNDGWQLTKTDICAIHNYSHGNPDNPADSRKVQFFIDVMNDPEMLLSAQATSRSVYADGYCYSGEPILLTEVGGVAYQNDATKSWGYTQADSEDAYLSQLEHVFGSILDSEYVFGFCYTQLTDVEQETNGLLTYDREFKVEPEKIREILSRWRPNVVRQIPGGGCGCC